MTRPATFAFLRRLNPWRFRGMIRPMMALSFDDSGRVSARKGQWMVAYLRARREVHEIDPLFRAWPRQRALRSKAHARQRFFAERISP
jgi:hypothetical protein